MNNRTFALAKESGRKTAMWVRQEHSDLFQHKVAEPEIKVIILEVMSLIKHITLSISDCHMSYLITYIV